MNKKLTKLLSIFLIAGAIGAGSIAAVGCNKTDDPPAHDVHIDADGDGKCDNGGEDFSATPTAITVNQSAHNVVVGGTVTLSAEVTGDNGKPSQEVTYTVYEADGTTVSTKATISGNTLTAVSEGTVKVIATSTAKTDVKSGAVTITIRANTKFGQISTKSNNIISEDFQGSFEGGKLPTYTEGVGAGVYGRAEQAGDGSDKCYVTVENGVAKTVETESAIQVGGKNSNTHIVVNLGPVKGVVEGYFEFKVGALADPGNSVRFTSGGEDVFCIFPAANNANFKYYKGGNNNTGTAITSAAQTAVTSSTTTTYNTYFKFDLTAGTLTLEINGQAVFTDYDIGVNALDGFYLTTSNASRRGMSVDNIAVAADAVSAADYKVSALAEIAAEAAKYPTVEGEGATYTINKTAVDAAVAAANSAVNASGATIAQMQAAVATLKTTLAAIENDAKVAELRQAAISAIKSAYPAYNYTENKSAYDAAIAAAETAINAATRTATITAAKNAAENQIKAIDNDEAVVNAYRATLEGTLAAYRPAEETDPLKAAIDAAVAAGNAKLAAAATKAACDKAIADAKAAIDEIYASSEKTFTEYQSDVIAAIDAYTTDVEFEPSSTRTETITEIKTTWKTTVGAMTEEGETPSTNADLAKALSDAKAAIDDKANEFAILDYFYKENDKLGEWFSAIDTHDNEIYANALVDACEVDTPESKPEDFKTTADVDALIVKVKADVQKIVDEWTKANNQKLTVNYANTDITAGKANFGYVFAKPATDPTQEDKRFVGWFEADLTTPFDFTAVQYGDFTVYAVWRESDVTIKLYNNADDDNPLYVIKAFSGEDPSQTVVLPEEAYASAVKFAHWYVKGQDATVAYTLPATFAADEEVELVAYFGGYKDNADLTQDNYTAPASGTVTNPIVNGNLFVVTTQNDVTKVVYYVKDITVGGKTFTQGVQSDNITDETEETAFTITAKEKIKIKVYLALGDSKLSSGRKGDVRYKLNGVDGDEPIVSEQGTAKTITGVLEIELNAGDVLDIYADNLSNGSRLYLYSVEAELADSFTNMSVEICDANGATHDTKQVSSLKAITEPDDDDIEFLGDVAITGWSYMVGDGAWTAITDWSAVPHTPGTTVLLKPTVAVPDVTVKFYDLTNGEYAVAKTTSKLSSSQTIAEADAPAETDTSVTQRIGWFTKSGDEYTEYTFGSALTADSTVELYARYKGTAKVSSYTDVYNENGWASVPTGTTGTVVFVGSAFTTDTAPAALTATDSSNNTYSFASGAKGIKFTNTPSSSRNLKLNLTSGKSYRIIALLTCSDSGNTRYADVSTSSSTPSSSSGVGSGSIEFHKTNDKNDGKTLKALDVSFTATQDTYYLNMPKNGTLYQLIIQEEVEVPTEITGLTGTLEADATDATKPDLSKLTFTLAGGTTLALNDAQFKDLLTVKEYDQATGKLVITYAGKVDYVFVAA